MKIRMEDTAIIVVDIQERLLPAMHEKEEVFEKCLRLFKGINTLNIPTIITQQYPKGLGVTYPEVLQELPSAELFDKMSFSCLTEEVIARLNALGKRNVLVCGFEAHVCVLQTVIDLVDNGFQPVLVVDCISSRNVNDKIVAMERAKAEGAILTTYESLLFELIVGASHQNFKEISKIVK